MEEPICAEEKCEEFGYYERQVFDEVADRKYYIYLCELHRGEFDSYHSNEEK
jgi:hypothetical protein